MNEQEAPIQPLEQPALQEVSPKKTYGKQLWLIIVLILSAIIGGIYVTTHENNTSQTAISPAPSKKIAITETPGWKTYNNKAFGFSLQYPADYSLTCFVCDEMTDDIEWASVVAFNPPNANEFGTINFTGYGVTNKKPGETIQEYVTRTTKSFIDANPQSGSTYTTIKEFKLDTLEAVQTEQVFQPGKPPYLIRTEFFLNDTPSELYFSDASVSGSPRIPIRSYPNYPVYEEMLSSFKLVKLPQTRKIDASFKPSPDGMYFIRGLRDIPDRLIIVHKNGSVISNDVLADKTNSTVIKTFDINCYECYPDIGDWVDTTKFSIVLSGVRADNGKAVEYTYLIDAPTGKVVPGSFTQVK